MEEKLYYKWNELHELDEQLEHIESGDLMNWLETFLSYPAIYRHGDKILDETSKLKKIKTQPLTLAPLQVNYRSM